MSSTTATRIGRVLLLLAVPLLLRAAVFWELRRDPFFHLLVVDARTYHDTALQMASGSWRMDGPFWQPPFYPVLMSWVYRVHASPSAVRLLQLLLGSLSTLLVFRLGERLGGRRSAWIAWGMAALCGPLLFFDLQILNASLVTFLLLASIDQLAGWAQAPRARTLVIAGLLLGLASITVATSLVLYPVFAFWVGRRRARSREGAPRGRALRPTVAGLRAATVLLICAALPVLAVTTRNYAASRQLVLISYNGGVNFWIGNNRDYDRAVAIRPGRAWQSLTAEPIQAGVRTEAGTSDWFFRQARHWIGAHPLDWIRLLLKKTYLFVRGDELARNQEIYPFRSSSLILRGLLWCRGLAFPSGLLIPLGLAGLVWLHRRPRSDRSEVTSLLALSLGAYALGVIVFFVASRYRAPVLPLFILFAAAFATRAWDALRARRSKDLLWPGALAGALLIVSNAGLPEMPRAFHSDTYSDMGTSHFEAGRFDAAVEWYERALELDANNAEAAHNLGAIWLKRDRAELAEPLFRRVLAAWPQDEKALINLGNCYLRRGEPYRAGRYFLDALSFHPESADAATDLQTADEMAGGLERERMAADPATFLDLLERLQTHEPENEFLRQRLRALRAGGRPRER